MSFAKYSPAEQNKLTEKLTNRKALLHFRTPELPLHHSFVHVGRKAHTLPLLWQSQRFLRDETGIVKILDTTETSFRLL